ncbi:zf-HC2 domain-containing protein [Haloechinothrix sp. LS1_15]|uniref:anti-sigma factor family protein n=1 Tax=Haloechinothrix sp. LS1_15 TaxID=2652248 RepID=UPI0029469661|nr:zf-HC2 domain-containing protein [Haloechinothrix sp. LS1_15]MDV6013621.1 zf-HC2 domain-containing protein [Haloechinothrix sp. LS1_15]
MNEASRSRAGSPLRCWRTMRDLQPYLDGEIDEVVARRVTRHLEECLRCGLEAETYRAIKDAVARRRRPPSDALARLRAFSDELLGEHEDPESRGSGAGPEERGR